MEIKQLIDELAYHNSQAALRSLFMLFYPKLMLFISYYIKSKHEAEEIVSDTFLSVWEQRDRLPAVHNLRAYIYTIAKNLSISHVRKETHKRTDMNLSEIEYTVTSSADPEASLIESELMSALNMAIESLPEKCKQAFWLVREHGLKYREAAEILEISEKTLEAHMALAVKRIRDKLHITKNKSIKIIYPAKGFSI